MTDPIIITLEGPPKGRGPIVVDLPWPRRALHPNARMHWRRKAQETKNARRDAAILAYEAGARKLRAEAILAAITFYPPDRRRRDADGVIASLKAAIDGVADVIGVDDSKWSLSIRRGEPRPPLGSIRIELFEDPTAEAA